MLYDLRKILFLFVRMKYLYIRSEVDARIIQMCLNMLMLHLLKIRCSFVTFVVLKFLVKFQNIYINMENKKDEIQDYGTLTQSKQ